MLWEGLGLMPRPQKAKAQAEPEAEAAGYPAAAGLVAQCCWKKRSPFAAGNQEQDLWLGQSSESLADVSPREHPASFVATARCPPTGGIPLMPKLRILRIWL